MEKKNYQWKCNHCNRFNVITVDNVFGAPKQIVRDVTCKNCGERYSILLERKDFTEDNSKEDKE